MSSFVVPIVVFVLAMLAMTTLLILGLRRSWRAGRRLQQVERIGQGKCPSCGYDLMGRITDFCPECGHRFTAHERKRLDGIAVGLKRMRERGISR